MTCKEARHGIACEGDEPTEDRSNTSSGQGDPTEPEITRWVLSLWKPLFRAHKPEALHTQGTVVCSEAGNQRKCKQLGIGSKGQEYSLATVTEAHQ